MVGGNATVGCRQLRLTTVASQTAGRPIYYGTSFPPLCLVLEYNTKRNYYHFATEYRMDVKLYVYDLSRGMARAMSQSFLGTQIDAIYHTSIVYNGIEYFFGQGIQQSRPGATHHGQPMEVVDLGQTQLPPDVVKEYLQSMASVYTAEAYDLFQNNCNNFSNDFAQFLVGRGIPNHIVSLPKTVLDTPFGQMLRPQLDASMRSITQAPVAASSAPSASSVPNGTTSYHKPSMTAIEHGTVYLVTQRSDLDRLLSAASSSFAAIFFTSSTCAPCRIAYPTYDALAGEYPRGVFIKIDLNAAPDLGSPYSVRATPTFFTFLRGAREGSWSGADPSRLRSTITALADRAFPPHKHAALDVRSLRLASLRPVTFAKIPPLDKLIAKLGGAASEPAVLSMRDFVKARTAAADTNTVVPLPDLAPWAAYLSSAPSTLPRESLFALVDLARCALLEPRVSAWFALSSPTSVTRLISHVSALAGEGGDCPYALRLVTLQLAATLFSAPTFVPLLLHSDTDTVALAAGALLAKSQPPALRAAAASLAFNIAAANYRGRREAQNKEPEPLTVAGQVELVAALVEMFGEDGSGTSDGGHAALVALGLLVYFAEQDGDVLDLCAALGAKEVIQNVKAEGKVENVRTDVVEVLT